MAILLKYQDLENWTDIELNVIDWTNLSKLYKEGRSRAIFAAPVVVTDIWNGIEHKVQEIVHTAWEIEFFIRESEVQEINRILSVDTIQITDAANGLDHTADTSPNNFEMSEPEQVADTANFKVIIKYKTNKTVIDKTSGLDNEVTLTGSMPGTYYSKFDKVKYFDEYRPVTTTWADDTEVILHDRSYTGYHVLMYLTESELGSIIYDYNTATWIIDAVAVVKKLQIEHAEIAEDLYRVVIPFIVLESTSSPVSGLSNAVTLVGSGTFYSKFAKLYLPQTSIQLTTPWPDGSDRLLRETARTGYKVLLYLSNADLQTFQIDFNQNSFTIDAATIYEKLPLEITPMESGYFVVIVSVITAVAQNTYDLTPLNTHTIVVTDSGTYTFYTDYAVEDMPDDTKNNDYTDNDFVEVTAQSVTKLRKKIKLFLDEDDTNSIKTHFERGTATLDTVAILQKEIVNVTKLGFDLYEVDILALMTTVVTNQL